MAQFLDLTGLTRFKNKNDGIYAKKDGYYQNLGAGVADQLSSTVGIEDKTPYNSRTSGGSVDIGDREELNAVVGVSVPWNQIYTHSGNRSGSSQNVTITDNEDGSFTLNGTATANGNFVINSTYEIPLPKMHVFYVCGYKAGTGGTNNYLGFAGLQIDKGVGGLWKNTTNYDALGAMVDFSSGTVYDNVIIKPQVFDLTAMLGSTIADYIYALEQSNAGSGVAYFKKLFPKPYYAYNSSEMLSVRTNLHRMTGFNQCNDSIHSGHYWAAGTLETNKGANYAAIDSKIMAIPNTQYCVYIPDGTNGATLTVYLNQWDAGGNYIGEQSTTIGADNLHVFTTEANVAEIAVSFYRSGGATTGERICINLSWDGERDGEYEPYTAHAYALDDIILRGILKLDANNNLYADGDRYLPDGTVTRKRKQIVLDGSTKAALSVTLSNGTYYSVFSISDNKSVDSGGGNHRIITDKGYKETVAVSVGNIYVTNAGTFIVVCLFDQTLTTTSAVNTYLSSNPITVEYELATPTTETAFPYQQTQIVDDFGTEEFVDAAVEANERDVTIPVGHETFYQNNLKAKLEMAPNSPDGDGVYVVQQTNGENEYVPLVIPVELPTFPSDDGTYVLKITVSGGTVSKAWVEEV